MKYLLLFMLHGGWRQLSANDDDQVLLEQAQKLTSDVSWRIVESKYFHIAGDKELPFRKPERKVDLELMMPICQDFEGNFKEEGIYRINLSGVSSDLAPTGNWGYVPFQVRYKTKAEAKKVRTAIFEAILQSIS